MNISSAKLDVALKLGDYTTSEIDLDFLKSEKKIDCTLEFGTYGLVVVAHSTKYVENKPVPVKTSYFVPTEKIRYLVLS
jgi:hypothetical protein